MSHQKRLNSDQAQQPDSGRVSAGHLFIAEDQVDSTLEFEIMHPIGTCLRCGVEMEAGRVLDRGQLSIDVGRTMWRADRSDEGGMWDGISGHRKLDVVTMRCPKCGLLESYARDPSSTETES